MIEIIERPFDCPNLVDYYLFIQMTVAWAWLMNLTQRQRSILYDNNKKNGNKPSKNPARFVVNFIKVHKKGIREA